MLVTFQLMDVKNIGDCHQIFAEMEIVREYVTGPGLQIGRSICDELISRDIPCEPYLALSGSLAVAFLIFLFVVVYLFSSLFSKSRGNTIVLMGLCDAGKTTMLVKLVQGKMIDTVTSMQANEITCKELHKETVQRTKSSINFVDFPGHNRLRSATIYQESLDKAAGIIYVLDMQTFNQQVRANADYLYEILTNAGTYKGNTIIQIACNKSEDVMATSKQIRKKLESELDKVRATRSRGPGDVGEGDNDTIILGETSSPFSFDQLPFEIVFCECSVKEDNLDSVKNFIRRAVP